MSQYDLLGDVLNYFLLGLERLKVALDAYGVWTTRHQGHDITELHRTTVVVFVGLRTIREEEMRANDGGFLSCRGGRQLGRVVPDGPVYFMQELLVVAPRTSAAKYIHSYGRVVTGLD